jgi:hypothetical protein
MWRVELTSSHDVLFIFMDWLGSAQGQAHIAQLSDSNEGAPCLLDIIAAWVQSDDQIVWIPSYGLFMAGVTLITASWLREDKEAVEGITLWRDPTTGDRKRVEDLTPGDDEHQLLNPTAFDTARSCAQQKQLQEIHQTLRGLMSKES